MSQRKLMRVRVDSESGLEKQVDEFEPTTFKDLALKEDAVEKFIRDNIDVLFASDDVQEADGESLLIVGQQVHDVHSRRSDLTAVDGNGHLTLIEVKRDAADMEKRKEALEFQAIRYAASLATIDTPERLVELVYAPYVEKRRGKGEEFGEERFRSFTAQEIARRKLEEFLSANNALDTFNQKQRIVLAASEFDPQTLSAVAWLSANNVNIACFKLTPGKLLGEYFIDIEKLLPPPVLRDSFVELRAIGSRRSTSRRRTAGGERQTLPKIPQLLESGQLRVGDALTIRGEQDSRAEVVSANQVNFEGERISYNAWGQRIKGWSSIRIYDWAVQERTGKTFGELREQMLRDSEDQSDKDEPAENDVAGEEPPDEREE